MTIPELSELEPDFSGVVKRPPRRDKPVEDSDGVPRFQASYARKAVELLDQADGEDPLDRAAVYADLAVAGALNRIARALEGER